MATVKVRATTTQSWANVIGAASGVAGMTWQNEGPGRAVISFSAAAPGASDARHVLERGQAYYDKAGSTAFWIIGDQGAVISGTSD